MRDTFMSLVHPEEEKFGYMACFDRKQHPGSDCVMN